MATVVDVAAYILKRCGAMTTMKLQKLAFYSQAESLARRGHPLSEEEKQTIDAVCAVLSSRTGNELSIRTHAESPWKIARGDLPPSAPCGTIISKKTIQEYYAANPIVRESMQKQVPTPNTFI